MNWFAQLDHHKRKPVKACGEKNVLFHLLHLNTNYWKILIWASRCLCNINKEHLTPYLHKSVSYPVKFSHLLQLFLFLLILYAPYLLLNPHVLSFQTYYYKIKQQNISESFFLGVLDEDEGKRQAEMDPTVTHILYMHHSDTYVHTH